MKYSTTGTTTLYISNGYEVTATSTKHIYAGEDLVGNVTGSGLTASLYTVHNDHLTGSNVVTNNTGALEELTDYLPYGKIRLDERTSSFKESRKYTGHTKDDATDLSYMKARYYDGKIGRFQSQDPMFQAIGTDLQRFDRTQDELLSNPQEMNSYSYVMNNPLKYVDPTGELSVRFSDFANSRQEFTSEQVQSTSYQNLPYYYRQTGDPSGTVRVNEQKIQDLGTLAAGLALILADGGVRSYSLQNSVGFLRTQEALGGHAIAEHVGKSTAELASRFANPNFTGNFSTSFTSEAMGNFATYQNIKNNMVSVDGWMKNSRSGRLEISSNFENSIGYGIDRSGNMYNMIKNVTTILRKTPDGRSFFSKTSYPLVN